MLKIIQILTLTVTWAVISGAHAAPLDLIRQTNAALTSEPWRSEEIAARAASQMNNKQPNEAATALYDALKLPKTEMIQWPTVFRIVEQMEDFDIDTWVSLIEREADPFVADYAMKIASSSKKADADRFKSFLHKALSDRRVGRALTGEARAYVKEGLRICDDALNILWHREPPNKRPPGYPFDVSNSTKQKRDQLIVDYAQEFGVTLTDSSSTVAEPQESVEQRKFSPKSKPSERDSVSQPPREEPTSPTAWSVIVILIVSASCLLWLLLKGRK